MKRTIVYISLLQFLCVLSCTSPQKLFDQGNYEKALYSSISDLQKSPADNNAKQLLLKAYGEASRQYLLAIEEVKNSNSEEKPDLLYKNYQALQKMYNAIVAVPAARAAVSPVDYSTELNTATDAAASFRYERGLELLQAGGRQNARKAYDDLKMAETYIPGYRDVAIKKKEASELATTNVVLNNIRQQFGFYSINGAFLEHDILWELKSAGRDNFYAFYTSADAQYKNIRVDQLMDLFLYDIWFGTLSVTRNTYNVSKQITEPAANPKDPPVKVTVTATVSVTRQVIDSRAVMDCSITDMESRRLLFSERFPARYAWENLSGSYSGDSRALSARDMSIVNGGFDNPPSYDELYRLLTRQIISDFTFRMRQVYGR